jgi:hypothetical protein
MPLLTPGRRWQPPYKPFKAESFGQQLLETTEIAVKGPIWGCRMCGNCLLQETAFICPMECPKGIRNGPCGGSTSEHCEVDETRPCIWYEIYDRAFKLGREEMLLEVLPPLDWEKVGGSRRTTSKRRLCFARRRSHSRASPWRNWCRVGSRWLRRKLRWPHSR